MIKLKLLQWRPADRCYYCRILEGHEHFAHPPLDVNVDIFVDGCIDVPCGEEASLVGRFVLCDDVGAIIYAAGGVKLLNEKTTGQ